MRKRADLIATGGQFYWPSLGTFVTAYGQFFVAANTVVLIASSSREKPLAASGRAIKGLMQGYIGSSRYPQRRTPGIKTSVRESTAGRIYQKGGRLDVHRNLVESAFADLRLLTFPRPPEDPDLTEWIMELLELDGFYAGIATSVAAGSSPVVLPKRDELDSLRAWLEELRVVTEEDEVILEQCRRYLQVLERLHYGLFADTPQG